MTLPVTRTNNSYFLFTNTGHIVIYKIVYMYRNNTKKRREESKTWGVILQLFIYT